MVTLQGSATAVHNIPSMTTNNSCYRCGRKGHQQSNCKFKSATCHHCGKVGHIKPACKSLKSSSFHETRSHCRPRSFRPSDRSTQLFRRLSRSEPSGLRQLQDVPTDRTEYSLFTVPSSVSRDPLYATVHIEDVLLTMEVDTGASFSVISKSTYDQMLSSHDLKPTTV